MKSPPTRASRLRPHHLWPLGGLMALSLVLWACSTASAGSAVTACVTRAEADRFPSVRCFVTVTDEKGQSLPGLTLKSFTVLEDDAPVGNLAVSSVLPGDETIAVVLVLDRSGSMRGSPIKAAVAAASDFAGRLSESDSLGMVTFSSKVDVPVAPTTDRSAVVKHLARIRASGETALYDAVHWAIGALSREKVDRRALVALTDGQDNASAATAQQCADAARADGVSVYCVGLGRSVNEKALRLVAEQTGGLLFLTGDPDSLVGIYRKIAHQLKSQYELSYTSPRPSADNSWRTVVVSVREKGTESSDRRQYLAAAQTGTAKPPGGGPPVGTIGLLLAAFVLLDVVLVIAILFRRSSSRQSGGGVR